jgi:hypothetical protein
VEIVGAMVNDRLHCYIQVGLIEIRRVSRLEIAPFARIHFVFTMNPQFRFVIAIERRVIEQIRLDQFIIFFIRIRKFLFELVSEKSGNS